MTLPPMSQRLAALADEVRRFERGVAELVLPEARAMAWDDRGRSLLTREKIAEQSSEAMRLFRQFFPHAHLKTP